VLDAFGWPGMTAADEHRVLSWKGYFLLGSDIVHEAHPDFAQRRTAAINATAEVKEAQALDIAARMSDEALGLRTDLDAGQSGRFQVMRQGDPVARFASVAEEYMVAAMRGTLAAEDDPEATIAEDDPEATIAAPSTTPAAPTPAATTPAAPTPAAPTPTPAARKGPTPRKRAAPKTPRTPAAGRKRKAAEAHEDEEEEDDGPVRSRQKKATAGSARGAAP
jgi:hypothetical protein